MTSEEIGVARIEGLLRELESLSNHERVRHLARCDGISGERHMPTGDDEAIIIPIASFEQATALLHEVDCEIQKLDVPLRREANNGLTDHPESATFCLGTVSLQWAEYPILRGSFQLVSAALSLQLPQYVWLN